MIFKNILLAYQLENYYILRFLKFIYTHPRFWIYGSKRHILDYTPKAKLILVLGIIFFLGDILGTLYLSAFHPAWIFLLPLCIILIPVYFVIVSILISPLDSYLKKRIIRQAKAKLIKFPQLKVIAITGSYGKTTTKEILHKILSESFQVLSTEGTKNTPLGIARRILEQLDKKHEILIVEMGAYTKGNIKELCDMVNPDISIITGITLQHLERFGNLENIIDAKFEILEGLSEEKLAILDTTSIGVQTGLRTKKLKVKNIIEIHSSLPYNYLNNLEGIEFDFEGEKIRTKLLSDYIGNTLQICYQVGKYLGQDIAAFRNGVEKIDFIEHRMQLIHNPKNNIFILDDSFNGNLQGIESIIQLLKKAPFSGRKIIVAGGVVELGEMNDSINSELGEKFAEVADFMLLVEGKVGNAIELGLQKKNFQNIKKYSSALELHDDLKNIILPGDLVVFQNDLPDNYL